MNSESYVLEEEVNMVLTMLAHLEKEVNKAPQCFRATSELVYNSISISHPNSNSMNQSHMDFLNFRKTKNFNLSWFPGIRNNNQDERITDSAFSNIERLQLTFSPTLGHLTFNCNLVEDGTHPSSLNKKHPNSYNHNEYDNCTEFNTSYDLGMQNTDTIINMKKMFLRMYRTVENYWEIETPKANKDRTTNFICHVFPKIVDDILMKEIEGEAGDN